MQIGILAAKTGVSRDTIRFYEKQGLLKSSYRKSNNYKVYNDNAILVLRFIRTCKDLGFTLKEIKAWLSEVFDESITYLKAQEKFQSKITEIKKKIIDLKEISSRLKSIVVNCPKHPSSKKSLYVCQK